MDTWDDDWGYYGNYECKKCCYAVIEYVACCDECADAIRHKRGEKMKEARR